MFAKCLAAFALLVGSLLGQTVTVGNYSGSPFVGWVRATIDTPAPAPAGRWQDGTQYVVGRRVGSVQVIDVNVTLQPGQIRTLTLATSSPFEFTLGSLDADLGWPSVGNMPLAPAAGKWFQADGAAYLVHLHTRVNPMVHVDYWVRAYPGQPWFPGELVVTASNPTVPDMSGVIPDGLALKAGAAMSAVPGLPWNASVLPAGAMLGDGQARTFPITLGWASKMTALQAISAQSHADQRVFAVGNIKVSPLGNPIAGDRFDSRLWANSNHAGSITRLHNWDAGPLGVSAVSSNTGAQEDQGFAQGGESQLAAGPSGALVRYLVALGQSRRPMHHLEADGSQLQLGGHPQLILWSSRPHWHTGVSPDRLGKPRELNQEESHRWYGPDREHWLINTLASAARLTGSPALQWQLEAHARVFLFGETVDPSASTSGTDAARSAGWAGMVVAHLWDTLENRELAELVAERWRARVRQVYIPRWGPAAGGIWDHRDDARLLMDLTGYTEAWMPYQQAVGAYGIWLASSMVGPPEGVTLAQAAARTVVDHAYRQQPGGQWVEWEVLGFQAGGAMLPDSEYVERRGAHRTGWFREAWFPLGVYVSARAGYPKARAIWDQVIATARTSDRMLAWFPAGL